MRDDESGQPDRHAGDTESVYGLFDAMPLMMLGTTGPEHRITAVTGLCRRFLGRDDLLGSPLSGIGAGPMGHADTAVLDQVLATGDPGRLSAVPVRIGGRDSGPATEAFMDFDASAQRGPDGAVTGVVVRLRETAEPVRHSRPAPGPASAAEQRYEHVHSMVDALQRELLPRGLPVLPQLEIAASYLPADSETAAGGDWFDAVPVGDGRVALVVGDVVGHGVTASAAMGQLRVVLRERLAATGDLVSALAALNEAAAWIPGAQAATVCVTLIDPRSGGVSYCTAGHPAPLLVTRGGEAVYLPATGAAPLGVGEEFDRDKTGMVRLDIGTTVLLYSDGILERPGRTLPQSSVELAQAVGGLVAGRAYRDGLRLPERICERTPELLTGVTGHSDDITLLAAQRLRPPEPLDLAIPARPEHLAELRDDLAEWLTDHGAGRRAHNAVLHAVMELATNTVEHAYSAPDSPVAEADRLCRLTAVVDGGGVLTARVRDAGRWREPRPPSAERGHGLQLAAEVLDHFHIAHDAAGTTATVRHALTRPARLLTADRLRPGGTPAGATGPGGPADTADPSLVLDQPWAPSARTRVDGPLDINTTGPVEAALRLAGAAGTRNLTVDLTGVSHLGSAGVAALHRLTASHRASGTSLELYAPTGGPAETILTVVNLDHLTSDPHASAASGM